MRQFKSNYEIAQRFVRLFGLGLPILFASALPGCSGGGPRGPVDPGSCAASPAAELGGAWQLTGQLQYLDPEVSETYVPNGFDQATIQLQFVEAAGGELPSGAATCNAFYVVSSSSLDSTSPTGRPSTLYAISSTGAGLPDGLFVLAESLYYYPTQGVSVSWTTIPGSFQSVSSTVFTCSADFDVYDGNQIVAVNDNIPDFDDDEDGEIDEADEDEWSDGVDVNAVLVCSGRMTLTFSRGETLSIGAATRATLTLSGVFRDIASRESLDTQAWLTLDGSRITFMVDDHDGHGVAPMLSSDLVGVDERFAARVEQNEFVYSVRGHVAEDRVPSAVMVIWDGHQTRTLVFERKQSE